MDIANLEALNIQQRSNIYKKNNLDVLIKFALPIEFTIEVKK
jgi:hypothetical protein